MGVCSSLTTGAVDLLSEGSDRALLRVVTASGIESLDDDVAGERGASTASKNEYSPSLSSERCGGMASNAGAGRVTLNGVSGEYCATATSCKRFRFGPRGGCCLVGIDGWSLLRGCLGGSVTSHQRVSMNFTNKLYPLAVGSSCVGCESPGPKKRPEGIDGVGRNDGRGLLASGWGGDVTIRARRGRTSSDTRRGHCNAVGGEWWSRPTTQGLRVNA